MGYRYGGHRSQSEPANLQLGVSCTLYCTADSAQAAPGMQADSTRFKLIPLQGMMGVNIIPLNNKPVLFDTTFHVYLWLKQTTDATWAPPTVASSGTVKTLPFFRQNVNYSFEAVAGGDTTYWVNRMIRLYVPVSARFAIYRDYPAVHARLRQISRFHYRFATVFLQFLAGERSFLHRHAIPFPRLTGENRLQILLC